MIPKNERVKLLDRQSAKVSISNQCRWLGLNRSSVYYEPKALNDMQLSVMRVLDELYLEDPTRGTRRMSDELTHRGFPMGRFATRTFMKIMRLKTIYCRPRTTRIEPADYKYPYLLRNMETTYSNQVWAADITYIPMGKGERLTMCLLKDFGAPLSMKKFIYNPSQTAKRQIGISMNLWCITIKGDLILH